MKIKRLLSIDERADKRCHVCGTNLSVKYVTEILDPTIGPWPTDVCVCNRCILIGEESKDGGIKNDC